MSRDSILRGRRVIDVRPARIFGDLPLPWTGSSPPEHIIANPSLVELMSCARPLVLVGPRADGVFALVAGVETWATALVVVHRTDVRLRLHAVRIVGGQAPDDDALAAVMLTLASAARVRLSCRVLAGAIRPHLHRALGRPTPVRTSTLAALLGVSRQALSRAAVRSTSSVEAPRVRCTEGRGPSRGRPGRLPTEERRE